MGGQIRRDKWGGWWLFWETSGGNARLPLRAENDEQARAAALLFSGSCRGVRSVPNADEIAKEIAYE